MLGTISAVLTTTTVNVAIPDIMSAFGIGQDRAQWMATGALDADHTLKREGKLILDESDSYGVFEAPNKGYYP